MLPQRAHYALVANIGTVNKNASFDSVVLSVWGGVWSPIALLVPTQYVL